MDEKRVDYISDAGTKHLLSKQVGAKRASSARRRIYGKLQASGLKLPLSPTPQLIERAREVMGGIDFDPTSGMKS